MNMKTRRIILTTVAALAMTIAAPSAGAAEKDCIPSIMETPAAKAKTETVTFSVNGMHCKNCVKKITENISFEKGVKDLKTDLAKKTVTVTFDPEKTSADKLAAALRKLGYEAIQNR